MIAYRQEEVPELKAAPAAPKHVYFSGFKTVT